MGKNEVDRELRKIFGAIFPGVKDLNDESSSMNVKGWDSLKHVMLISEVENHFEIKFSLDDMLSMRSFGEIKKAVEDKL